MSWFFFREAGRRRRVHLRLSGLSSELREIATRNARPGEELLLVVVSERLPKGQVLLEFWAADAVENKRRRDNGFSERHTVFHAPVRADPEWICEGDMRG